MVIETRSFCFLIKKIVFNSRFIHFLNSFQETFPHRTRKMLTAYLKFKQSDFTVFFCFAKFYDLFLSIFNDLKIFFKNIVSFHEDNFFLLESIFCALSNEILHSLLL